MSEVIKIPLGNDQFALIDADDLPKIQGYKWRLAQSPNGGKYASAAKKKQGRITWFWMHRLIMEVEDGGFVDHVNRDGLDNRRANLRHCTRSQNQANRRLSRNTSGYRGVSKRKWGFEASIGRRYVGTYRTATEAAMAYDDAAFAAFGEFAQLNFPNPKTGAKE